MKKLMIPFLILFFANTGFAQTQAEMNREAFSEMKIADSILNITYKKVMERLTGNEKKLVIDAQRTWINFKETHCESVAIRYEGGSIQPLIKYSCIAEITRERTKQLEAFLLEY